MIEFLKQACATVTPMQVAFVIVLLFFVALIVSWARDAASKNFKLVHMVSSPEGFPDNNKLWSWGVFFLSSYAFLWLLWNDRFTEWFFIGYMAAWVGSGAYALKKKVESAPEPGLTMETTTQIKKTEIKPEPTVKGKK